MAKPRTTATMRFWVLCGNDFPSAVYSSEAKAEEAKKQLDEKRGDGLNSPRIHWHIHSFELNRNPHDGN